MQKGWAGQQAQFTQPGGWEVQVNAGQTRCRHRVMSGRVAFNQQADELADQGLMADQQQRAFAALGQKTQRLARIIVGRQPGGRGNAAQGLQLLLNQIRCFLCPAVGARQYGLQRLICQLRRHRQDFLATSVSQSAMLVTGRHCFSLTVTQDPDSHSLSTGASTCAAAVSWPAGHSMNGQGFCSVAPVT